jgi:Fatty acid hydroxylase superfamily
MGIEQFDQLGKVGQRSREAVDLVDHDDVDLAGADIVQKPLQVGTIGRSSGIAAIVIARADQCPAGMGLALDIGRGCLELRIQRIKILILILLATSTLKVGDATVFFFCGVVALTLAEYTVHRFLLHDIVPRQHRIHHAHPQDPIDKIFWQIWVGFAVVYLMTGGVVLAGALVAYAWYLFVHYCAHHNPSALPPFLLKHHRDHHRFANRNYGVTTTLWDHVFRTMLR